jgi:hypothetical protein
LTRFRSSIGRLQPSESDSFAAPRGLSVVFEGRFAVGFEMSGFHKWMRVALRIAALKCLSSSPLPARREVGASARRRGCGVPSKSMFSMRPNAKSGTSWLGLNFGSPVMIYCPMMTSPGKVNSVEAPFKKSLTMTLMAPDDRPNRQLRLS